MITANDKPEGDALEEWLGVVAPPTRRCVWALTGDRVGGLANFEGRRWRIVELRSYGGSGTGRTALIEELPMPPELPAAGPT